MEESLRPAHEPTLRERLNELSEGALVNEIEQMVVDPNTLPSTCTEALHHVHQASPDARADLIKLALETHTGERNVCAAAASEIFSVPDQKTRADLWKNYEDSTANIQNFDRATVAKNPVSAHRWLEYTKLFEQHIAREAARLRKEWSDKGFEFKQAGLEPLLVTFARKEDDPEIVDFTRLPNVSAVESELVEKP